MTSDMGLYVGQKSNWSWIHGGSFGTTYIPVRTYGYVIVKV